MKIEEILNKGFNDRNCIELVLNPFYEDEEETDQERKLKGFK